MTIPVGPRIGALVLATTAFSGYVGQMVPQNEVQPPEDIYVEEKGASCESHAHRRNHTVSPERERYAAVSTTITSAHA